MVGSANYELQYVEISFIFKESFYIRLCNLALIAVGCVICKLSFYYWMKICRR